MGGGKYKTDLVRYKHDDPGRQLTWQNLGLGAFLSMASRDARSLGLVLMAESTVTPVPTPKTNVPISSAALRPDVAEAPDGAPKTSPLIFSAGGSCPRQWFLGFVSFPFGVPARL